MQQLSVVAVEFHGIFSQSDTELMDIAVLNQLFTDNDRRYTLFNGMLAPIRVYCTSESTRVRTTFKVGSISQQPIVHLFISYSSVSMAYTLSEQPIYCLQQQMVFSD